MKTLFDLFCFDFLKTYVEWHGIGPDMESAGVCVLIIIITEICKVSTLWLRALNKHNITRIMYIEMENVISN